MIYLLTKHYAYADNTAISYTNSNESEQNTQYMKLKRKRKIISIKHTNKQIILPFNVTKTLSQITLVKYPLEVDQQHTISNISVYT